MAEIVEQLKAIRQAISWISTNQLLLFIAAIFVMLGIGTNKRW